MPRPVQVDIRILQWSAPPHAAPPQQRAGELIDVCENGLGAALLMPQQQPVPLGARLSLSFPGEAPIQATVVSRLGAHGRYRVGLRVEPASSSSLLSVLKTIQAER